MFLSGRIPFVATKVSTSNEYAIYRKGIKFFYKCIIVDNSEYYQINSILYWTEVQSLPNLENFAAGLQNTAT